MVVAGWIALLVASFVIFAQAGLSLYLMLYTWDNSQRLAASSGPRSFLPPRLSFSILLPARHEEAVIFQTIKCVWASEYLRELIEIVVVCHASDTGTIAEAQRAIREIGSPRVRVETFTDGPISKPRGLNVGLQRTTNEVVTIFDAEDDVDHGVFNMINTVMLQEKTGVVQAGVQLMNFRDHWFSVHNCLEYFFYFKSRLHFHAKVGMIPLGGNTVFIRRDLMNRLGGWDQNCLTEDADIGLRLSALGERIRVVYDPQRVTREETPDSVTSFLRQRTRWNQGFLQVLRKGSWRSLSTWSQKALALYTMIYPVFHAIVTMLWPLVLVAVLLLNVPIVIALASFLPLYALLLQLAINVAGVYVFAGEYGLKVPILTPVGMAVSFMPFQFLLGCSALRAVYREARSQNNWEKTIHLGAHRRPEIALAADYELLLEETLSHLDVERGSVMVLDDAGRAFSIGASRGLSANVVGSARVRFGEGVVGWVAQTGTAVVINGHDIPEDLRGRLRQPDLLSSIVLPFKGDGAVAVLSLSSKTRELDEESLHWASRRVNTLFPTQTVRSALPATREKGEALSASRATTIQTPNNGRPIVGITQTQPASSSAIGDTQVLSSLGRDREDMTSSGRSKRKVPVALVLGTMQRLRTLPIPLKIAALAPAMLAVAAGMGVVAALAVGAHEGPLEGAKSERAGEANPEQGDRLEDVAEKAASDGSSEAAYLDEVADIQNGSVEASLRSNDKVLRYDGLTAEDVEELRANYAALESYARRARDLAPSAEHEDQYNVFVLAIGELRDANELAYRLAVDPFSATQVDFEAYDSHVDSATAYLRRSNEMLGKGYKTTGAAQEVSSLG